MAIRFMDGFDNYNTLSRSVITPLIKNYTSVSADICTPVIGRYGNSLALKLEGSKNEFSATQSISSSGVTSFIVGFNFYMPTLLIGSCDFMITIGTKNISRGIRIYAASNSVDPTIYLNGTSMGTITRNAWHFIEAYIPLTPSGGDPCNLYVDGISVGTTTNSISYDGSFKIWRSSGNNNDSCYLDDYYIMDNTGSSNNSVFSSSSYVPRIETLYAYSDVTNDWTKTGPSVGNATITETFEGYTITSFSTHQNTFFTNNGANASLLNGYWHCSNSTNTAYAGSKYLLVGRNDSTSRAQTKICISTIAETVSFYVKSDAYYSSPTITFYITVNGTRTAYTANSTWTLVTLTLPTQATIVIETDPLNSTNYPFCIDSMSFAYTNKVNAVSVQCPETPLTTSSAYLSTVAVGAKQLFELTNLQTIKSPKAAVAKVHNGYTSSAGTEKLLSNSDTEIGSTISSNSSGSSGNWNSQYFETNPLTSSAWTENDINSFQLGLIKKT